MLAGKINRASGLKLSGQNKFAFRLPAALLYDTLQFSLFGYPIIPKKVFGCAIDQSPRKRTIRAS
jgi:hypothetical protein